jgi:uncharacterized protein (DUF697 family)/tellurite resistance protein
MTVQLSNSDKEGIAAVCLLAAFADGRKGEQERAQVKQVVEAMEGGVPNVASLYQQVLTRSLTVDQAAGRLGTPEARTLAYEMAVGVCDADGVMGPEERSFLQKLAGTLGINAGAASQTVAQADELVALDLPAPGSAGSVTTAGVAGAAAAGAGMAAGALSAGTAATAGGAQAAASDPAREKEIDSSIMTNSILCGAIELLPQTLATAAIIPLQMRLVYGIGRRYGYTLDSGHIKDFLGVVGVGATSQVVESYARRFLGGLAKRIPGVGGVAKTAVNWGTGPAMTFATTYALGQVARQYYAGGRSLGAVDLKQVFGRQVESAQKLYEQVRPQIENRARTLNVGQIMQSVRGGV